MLTRLRGGRLLEHKMTIDNEMMSCLWSNCESRNHELYIEHEKHVIKREEEQMQKIVDKIYIRVHSRKVGK